MSTSSGEGRPLVERRLSRYLMQVVWPAFLSAVVAVGVFFSMIDPRELVFVGISLADTREGAYTVGFFLFWALFTVSSSLTWMLMQSEPHRVHVAAPPEAATAPAAPTPPATATPTTGPTIGGIPVRTAAATRAAPGAAAPAQPTPAGTGKPREIQRPR